MLLYIYTTVGNEMLLLMLYYTETSSVIKTLFAF